MSANLTIQPGTYRVRRDVINPKPDRRKSDNWTAAPRVKAGEVLVITASTMEQVAGIATIRCVGGSVYDRVSSHSPLAQALIPELEPIPESTRALLLRLEVNSWHLPSFLAFLVDSGQMSAIELEHAFTSWLAQPEGPTNDRGES